MTKAETKFVCDLLSLVGNAVATGTIPEAEDYLMSKYAGTDKVRAGTPQFCSQGYDDLHR